MSPGSERPYSDAHQTRLYAKYRPTYPKEVIQKIESFCKEGNSDFDVAVDVGCGTGQGTLPLLKFFKKVMGVDASEQQISNAPQVPNVTYHVSIAEDLSFIDASSVDLVSVAQAFHWFNDEDKFFKEADRILKPGGSLVVYGLGFCYMGHAKADAYFHQVNTDIFVKNMPIKPWKMVMDQYASVSLPYPGWVRDDNLSMEVIWTIDDFMGFVESLDPITQYKKLHPTENIVGEIKDRLTSLLSEGGFDQDRRFKVTWPVFMLMGHKPVS